MEQVFNSSTIDFDAEWNGKGRHFTSRFIEAGLVNYGEDHVYLVRKETIDKFIDTMVGCPVIVKHADVNDANVKDLSVGNISKVWFNDADGWFYCEGVLTDKDAIMLVEQGQSVSCGYKVLDKDLSGGYWHDIAYDAEILNGDFEHLAIVDNPRYRDANILLNESEINDMGLKSLFNAKSCKNESEDKKDAEKEKSLRDILNEIKDGKAELTEDLINEICGEDKDNEADEKDAEKSEKADNECEEKAENEADEKDAEKEAENEADEEGKKDAEDEKAENEADEEEKETSCENESDEEETKADDKEAEEKSENADEEKEDVKNSSDFDKVESLKNSVYQVQEPKCYMTQAERLELGKNY